MKIAHIVWRDALSEEATEPHTQVNPRLALLHEVGFLLGETDEVVTIGMEVDGDGETAPGRWRLHISKAPIQSMHVVDLDTFLAIKPKRKRKA